MSYQSIKFLRHKDVLSLLPIKNTSLHYKIKDGLFPEPVALGPRAVGWPEHEVKLVLEALLAGKPESEIKTLVNELQTTRHKEVSADALKAKGVA